MKTKFVIFILIVLSILFLYNIEKINSPENKVDLKTNDNDGFSLIENQNSTDNDPKTVETSPDETTNTETETDTTLSNSGMSKLTSTGMGR